jgi:hypothetical protein
MNQQKIITRSKKNTSVHPPQSKSLRVQVIYFPPHTGNQHPVRNGQRRGVSRWLDGLERDIALSAWLGNQRMSNEPNWQRLARRAIAERLFSRRADATHVGNLLARAWRSINQTTNN